METNTMIDKTKLEKPVRFQFDFSARLAREIERFEEESELTSHREFFANAVALWRWAAQKSREGKTIAAIEVNDDDDIDYVELSLPALDAVKAEAPSRNLVTEKTTGF
jgi:hypothetical protein